MPSKCHSQTIRVTVPIFQMRKSALRDGHRSSLVCPSKPATGKCGRGRPRQSQRMLRVTSGPELPGEERRGMAASARGCGGLEPSRHQGQCEVAFPSPSSTGLGPCRAPPGHRLVRTGPHWGRVAGRWSLRLLPLPSSTPEFHVPCLKTVEQTVAGDSVRGRGSSRTKGPLPGGLSMGGPTSKRHFLGLRSPLLRSWKADLLPRGVSATGSVSRKDDSRCLPRR